MPPELCLSQTRSYDSWVSNYGPSGKSAKYWHFSVLLGWRECVLDLSWSKGRSLWAGGPALILKTPWVYDLPNLNILVQSANVWPSYQTTNWVHYNEILKIDFEKEGEMVHSRKQISNSCVLAGIICLEKKKKRTLMRGHHVLRAGKSEHPKGHIRALSPWQETTKSGNSTERERFG